MSHDNHLTISCPCGGSEVIIPNGYSTVDLEETKGFGLEARSLCPRCRRKRFIRMGYFSLATVVIAAFLVAGSGWWMGERHKDEAKVEGRTEILLLHRAFAHYQEMEYESALKDLDEVLKINPRNENALEAKKLVLRYYPMGAEGKESCEPTSPTR